MSDMPVHVMSDMPVHVMSAHCDRNRQKWMLLITRKFATGARSMASLVKVIYGINAKDSKKSKRKGRSKTRRKRIRKLREKEKPIKTQRLI